MQLQVATCSRGGGAWPRPSMSCCVPKNQDLSSARDLEVAGDLLSNRAKADLEVAGDLLSNRAKAVHLVCSSWGIRDDLLRASRQV
jgi:hypothetical protein